MTGKTLRILHTNDLHGTLDDARQRRLAELRKDCDLYFDTGDCIKTGNLGIPLKPEPVWERLAALDCTASVPGNRESHVLRNVFEAKIAGHKHPILCANLFDKNGKPILEKSLTLDFQGVRVGVTGVMVPMVTDRMQSKAVSQMIWTQPIPVAIEESRQLGEGANLVIALTHIGIRNDRQLAEESQDIDLILGGHSHTKLDEPEKVGNTWICQGGSHGKFAGVYEWTFGVGLTKSELIPLLDSD